MREQKNTKEYQCLNELVLDCIVALCDLLLWQQIVAFYVSLLESYRLDPRLV